MRWIFRTPSAARTRAGRLSATCATAGSETLRETDGIEILTPKDPRLHGGITSFRFSGRTSEADNIAIAKRLLDEYRIFSVQRSGPAAGACVRITPALFNTARDMDLLVAALRGLLRAHR
jgi:isopenicillin-N epimerase